MAALPPLRDVIAQHELRAEKKFGQNFLLDLNITDKIARYAGDLSGKNVIEIGPGPGGLTRSLLMAGAKNLTAIEFDPRAVAALSGLVAAAQGRLRIVQGDALEIDLTAMTQEPRVIAANLPYNIATPLLTGWLAQVRQRHGAYDLMILMFQKEVAERLTAAPGSKDYGRLSVLAQWLCDVDRLFDLPPSAFTPPPKVTSSVVRFVPRALPPAAPPLEAVERVTAAAFNQRRKMLKSSLKGFPGLIERAGIDETLRPEQIGVADFIRLAKCLSSC
ncbi:MAG: 16S rRNA (adenine(1518)-N(6)/adenine(1519)-N(6))-dimethyltransferase RsmA [Micavibrio aeruginosavorus]|nr:16S rRNA (adenine(1518)-N(6)/adenine(1519)-N(6))-dimethyltransferase RsmA [Micavibrio aeruginosavorus]